MSRPGEELPSNQSNKRSGHELKGKGKKARSVDLGRSSRDKGDVDYKEKELPGDTPEDLLPPYQSHTQKAPRSSNSTELENREKIDKLYLGFKGLSEMIERQGQEIKKLKSLTHWQGQLIERLKTKEREQVRTSGAAAQAMPDSTPVDVDIGVDLDKIFGPDEVPTDLGQAFSLDGDLNGGLDVAGPAVAGSAAAPTNLDKELAEILGFGDPNQHAGALHSQGTLNLPPHLSYPLPPPVEIPHQSMQPMDELGESIAKTKKLKGYLGTQENLFRRHKPSIEESQFLKEKTPTDEEGLKRHIDSLTTLAIGWWSGLSGEQVNYNPNQKETVKVKLDALTRVVSDNIEILRKNPPPKPPETIVVDCDVERVSPPLSLPRFPGV